LYKQSAYNCCNPGYYLHEWRQKTGALSKVRLTGILEIDEMPTTQIPNIDGLIESSYLQSQKIEAVEPDVLVDEEGRPYLATTNPYEDTVDLAESLILKYRHIRGEYPAVIVLSSLRYLLRPSDHFIIGNKRIPYVHDVSVGIAFDVVVRGGNCVL
jgi:hypothetical protein